MSKERYTGERQALRHFLAELRPLVAARLGHNALLGHRIDLALKAGDLESLRNARKMFHKHPDALKRELMRGIFEETKSSDGEPAASQAMMSAPKDTETAAACNIHFNAFPAARHEDIALSVEMKDDSRQSLAPVQVAVKPGTLPGSAAEALRQIASWIEHDRRLLSTQHWARGDKRTRRVSETQD